MFLSDLYRRVRNLEDELQSQRERYYEVTGMLHALADATGYVIRREPPHAERWSLERKGAVGERL